MYKERIEQLQKLMQEKGIDFYYVPTADFHQSEYVCDYFKVRTYFSGFTGSNGSLMLTQHEAGLWTDGRYFIQAEQELSGSGIKLYKMLEEGVPTIKEYLKRNIKKGQVLGFDGRVVEVSFGQEAEIIVKENEARIVYEQDLADSLWKNRPVLPEEMVYTLPEYITGKSVKDKLGELRSKIKEAGCSVHILTKLDDIMWLLNIRGNDVPYNPVALSYVIVTQEEAYVFIQEQAIEDEVKNYFQNEGIVIKLYEEIYTFASSYKAGGKILYDKRYVNYTLFKEFSKVNEMLECENPSDLMKAIKNEVETENNRKAHIKDGVAFTKFMYYIKENIGKVPMTEITASDYLEKCRREQEGLLDLSFSTIAGYKENAAMMHYDAEEETCKALEPEGLLLVDSGGQYMGGTTDITRTLVLGRISSEQKIHFTAVVKGMLRLSSAKFLHGCVGRNLDILARGPIWDLDIDYKCGTGHGVGYMLNVHEGPQGIRYKMLENMKEAVIEAGMLLTNEPGIYIEGSHGIRIENELVCHKGVKNGDGQFLYFETITFAPIDLDAIDVSQLTEIEKGWLNSYHKEVYEKIMPYLNKAEQDWLQKYTRGV